MSLELEKAKTDLLQAEKLQEAMKIANAIIRSGKNVSERLVSEAKLTEAQAEKIQQKDFAGRTGFPTYQLTNNNAYIKRLKDKINILDVKTESAAGEEERYSFDGGSVLVNYTDDRVQIFHDKKPEPDQITALKKSGWKWSPKNTAWQRKITPQAISSAKYITKATGSAPVREQKGPIDHAELLESRKFSYVSVSTYGAMPPEYTGDKSFNLVYFDVVAANVKEAVKAYFKEHLPEVADHVKVDVYPKTYIKEAKALVEKDKYLPTDAPAKVVLAPGYQQIKNFFAMQKDLKPQTDSEILYTSAPSSYDGFGTETVETLDLFDRKENPVRKVSVKDSARLWQTNRYQSGNFGYYNEADFTELTTKYPDSVFHKKQAPLPESNLIDTKDKYINWKQQEIWDGTNNMIVRQNSERLPDETEVNYQDVVDATNAILKSGRESDKKVANGWAEQMVLAVQWFDPEFKDWKNYDKAEKERLIADYDQFGIKIPDHVREQANSADSLPEAVRDKFYMADFGGAFREVDKVEDIELGGHKFFVFKDGKEFGVAHYLTGQRPAGTFDNKETAIESAKQTVEKHKEQLESALAKKPLSPRYSLESLPFEEAQTAKIRKYIEDKEYNQVYGLISNRDNKTSRKAYSEVSGFPIKSNTTIKEIEQSLLDLYGFDINAKVEEDKQQKDDAKKQADAAYWESVKAKFPFLNLEGVTPMEMGRIQIYLDKQWRFDDGVMSMGDYLKKNQNKYVGKSEYLKKYGSKGELSKPVMEYRLLDMDGFIRDVPKIIYDRFIINEDAIKLAKESWPTLRENAVKDALTLNMSGYVSDSLSERDYTLTDEEFFKGVAATATDFKNRAFHIRLADHYGREIPATVKAEYSGLFTENHDFQFDEPNIRFPELPYDHPLNILDPESSQYKESLSEYNIAKGMAADDVTVLSDDQLVRYLAIIKLPSAKHLFEAEKRKQIIKDLEAEINKRAEAKEKPEEPGLFDDLPEMKHLDDVEKNVDTIAEGYADRGMAALQVVTYLNKFANPYVSSFMRKHRITTKEQMTEYVNKRQSVLRAGKGNERSEFLKAEKSNSAESHVDNILNMAKEQSAEMDQKIVDHDAALPSDWNLLNRYPKLSKKEVEVAYNRVEEILSQETLSEQDKYVLEQYEGLGSQTQTGIIDKGLLHQFYTPYIIAKKMYELGYKYGVPKQSPIIVEPSMGTGRFFKFAPKGSTCIGFDPDKKNVEIAKILYPEATIYQQEFETAFLEAPRYNRMAKKSWLPEADLCIGNPPYGDYMGYYKSYMPSIFKRFEFLFVYLGLKTLKKDGLLIFIVSQNFMNNGAMYNGMKAKILELGTFVDAIRMPNGIFSSTEVGTDIIIFRKK